MSAWLEYYRSGSRHSSRFFVLTNDEIFGVFWSFSPRNLQDLKESAYVQDVVTLRDPLPRVRVFLLIFWWGAHYWRTSARTRLHVITWSMRLNSTIFLKYVFNCKAHCRTPGLDSLFCLNGIREILCKLDRFSGVPFARVCAKKSNHYSLLRKINQSRDANLAKEVWVAWHTLIGGNYPIGCIAIHLSIRWAVLWIWVFECWPSERNRTF